MSDALPAALSSPSPDLDVAITEVENLYRRHEMAYGRSVGEGVPRPAAPDQNQFHNILDALKKAVLKNVKDFARTIDRGQVVRLFTILEKIVGLAPLDALQRSGELDQTLDILQLLFYSEERSDLHDLKARLGALQTRMKARAVVSR